MARPRPRLSHTRRRRINAHAFGYAARTGHFLATTLWITLLATGIAAQFLWGILLGLTEGMQQLKTAWLTRHDDDPPKPKELKTNWKYTPIKRTVARLEKCKKHHNSSI